MYHYNNIITIIMKVHVCAYAVHDIAKCFDIWIENGMPELYNYYIAKVRVIVYYVHAGINNVWFKRMVNVLLYRVIILYALHGLVDFLTRNLILFLWPNNVGLLVGIYINLHVNTVFNVTNKV